MSLYNGTRDTDYTLVRVCASTISFITLAFFNILINWTIVREARLRCHARFVLVFHLLVSALVYFGFCSVFYLQIYLDAKPGASICEAMVTVLITSASNILLTITAMALDRYLAVCQAMRYDSVWHWPWLVGLLTWGIALIIPLTLLPKTDAAINLNEGKGLLQPGTKDLSAVVNFAFFSLAQCFAPIVYGLRKEELLEQVQRRYPCFSRHLKTVLQWTVRGRTPGLHPLPRERTFTSQTLMSFELHRTSV
ncbi:hypothetical protein UPYG_G00239940 [Umbra pygmaea]|uniref:G-protein coupled receptors family 1 profile domain-containing protein n=1 Tax=Umbra pygmaea TaxID=75934 RepID=A0ABD0WF32_UMBPY